MRTDVDEGGLTRGTPIGAVARGAAAGLAASVVLSALSRVLPGLWNERGEGGSGGESMLPADPHDPKQVRRWQSQSQSPAAFQPAPPAKDGQRAGGPLAVTP